MASPTTWRPSGPVDPRIKIFWLCVDLDIASSVWEASMWSGIAWYYRKIHVLEENSGSWLIHHQSQIDDIIYQLSDFEKSGHRNWFAMLNFFHQEKESWTCHLHKSGSKPSLFHNLPCTWPPGLQTPHLHPHFQPTNASYIDVRPHPHLFNVPYLLHCQKWVPQLLIEILGKHALAVGIRRGSVTKQLRSVVFACGKQFRGSATISIFLLPWRNSI